MSTTAECKRAWLQAVRNSQKMSVVEFAEALGWNRSDASSMLNGTGGRGIPDERIDQVCERFKLPCPVAETLNPTTSAVSREQFDRLLLKADAQASLLLELIAEVRRSRGQ